VHDRAGAAGTAVGSNLPRADGVAGPDLAVETLIACRRAGHRGAGLSGGIVPGGQRRAPEGKEDEEVVERENHFEGWWMWV